MQIGNPYCVRGASYSAKGEFNKALYPENKLCQAVRVNHLYRLFVNKKTICYYGHVGDRISIHK